MDDAHCSLHSQVFLKLDLQTKDSRFNFILEDLDWSQWHDRLLFNIYNNQQDLVYVSIIYNFIKLQQQLHFIFLSRTSFLRRMTSLYFSCQVWSLSKLKHIYFFSLAILVLVSKSYVWPSNGGNNKFKLCWKQFIGKCEMLTYSLFLSFPSVFQTKF